MPPKTASEEYAEIISKPREVKDPPIKLYVTDMHDLEMFVGEIESMSQCGNAILISVKKLTAH